MTGYSAAFPTQPDLPRAKAPARRLAPASAHAQLRSARPAGATDRRTYRSQRARGWHHRAGVLVGSGRHSPRSNRRTAQLPIPRYVSREAARELGLPQTALAPTRNSVEDLYQAEHSLLEGNGLIPLFHLPRGQRSRRARTRLGARTDWAFGHNPDAPLADVWLAGPSNSGGLAMSFRQKLLLLFAATILLCVAVMSVSVYGTMRRSFEQANQDRANAVAASFVRNSSAADKRSRAKSSRLPPANPCSASRSKSIAAVLVIGRRVGFQLPAEARTLAAQQQLDFLELVDHQGTILSSAQWQAKFGYNEPAIPAASGPAGAFLKREDLPRWPNPRPVCHPRRPHRRRASVCHRRRTARSAISFDARHSHRHARSALPEPRCQMESAIAARPERPRRRRRSPRSTH